MTGDGGRAPRAQGTEQRARALGGGEVTQAGRDVHRATHIHEAPAPARPSVIHGLRRDSPHFTGREAELGRLLELSVGRQAPIYTVNGMPGVGKTALVTRAAHLLAHHFPDGQLFVDLRAHTPGHVATDPVDVLATLLAGLGIDPRSLPATLEERSDLWRDQLAGRRVLLVLDDASSEAQIEPLLPGGTSCLTLVTSRRRLVGFDGGEPLPLDTLHHDEAVTLFHRLAPGDPPGGAPDAAESAAIDRIVSLCGCLPLAVVLLAGRLVHRPSWTVTDLADDFGAATDRLGHLVAGTRAVDAAFTLSYDDLPPVRQRLFRRLGLHPGPDICPEAAAALGGISLAEARDGLEELYTHHLLQETTPRRYSLHDLLRQFAAGRCTADDLPGDREEAGARLFEHYRAAIHTAEDVVSARSPGTPLLPGPDSALAWLRTERVNVLACLDQAAAHERLGRVVELTSALAPFLLREGHWLQAAELHVKAAVAARRTGDLHGEAGALDELGNVRYVTGDYASAIDFHGRALALYEQLGDPHGRTVTLNNLGRAHGSSDAYEAATAFHARALALSEDLGDRRGQAAALHGLGRVHYMTADYAASTTCNERALALFEELGDRRGQSNALLNLGFVQYMTGGYPAADHFQERALTLFAELGDRHGQASSLQDLGRVRFVKGDYAGAADLHERALAVFEDLGDRHGRANGLNNLGRIRFVQGDHARATDLHGQALAMFGDLGDRHGRANGLNNLARVRFTTGDHATAAELHARALALFEEIGNRHGRANALHGLGRVRNATGERAAADALYAEALGLFQEIGDPQGEAEVWNSLGALRSRTAGAREGLAAHRRALALARGAPSPLDEARALEGMARVHVLTGDVDGAMSSLREAVRIYDRIGAATAPADGDGTSDSDDRTR